MASQVKAAIVAVLAGGATMTAEELRAAIKAPDRKSIREVASKLAADGVLQKGTRRLKPGPGGTVSVFRLRRGADLPGAPATASAA